MKYTVNTMVLALAGLSAVYGQTTTTPVYLPTLIGCNSGSNQDATCGTMDGQCCGKIDTCKAVTNAGTSNPNQSRDNVCLMVDSGVTAASTGYIIRLST